MMIAGLAIWKELMRKFHARAALKLAEFERHASLWRRCQRAIQPSRAPDYLRWPLNLDESRCAMEDDSRSLIAHRHAPATAHPTVHGHLNDGVSRRRPDRLKCLRVEKRSEDLLPGGLEIAEQFERRVRIRLSGHASSPFAAARSGNRPDDRSFLPRNADSAPPTRPTA